MLGSRFLKYEPAERHGRMYRALEGGFKGVTRAYDVTLQRVLRHPFATVVFATAMLGGTVYLFLTMPTGFIPSQDTGFIQGATLASQDISFESMAKHQRAVGDILEHDPNVEQIGAFAGDSNQGFIFAMMKPRPGRKLNVDQVMMELRGSLSSVPGVMVFLQNPPPITINGQNTNSAYQMTLQSANLQEIYQWVPRLLGQMRGLPGFLDVTSDLQIQSPQVNLDIDRDRALSLGVSAEADPGRALQRLRHPPGLHHLYARQSVRRDRRDRAGVPAHAQRFIEAIRALFGRAAHPPRYAGQELARSGPAVGEPFRPASFGDCLLQSRARSFAGPGGR